ncbi:MULTISPECIES: nucleotidyltransferase domain-containing protein [Halorussus]|uniref:nucleotidyltransferase domain-containing protein n=1 Tax=Halorussus TaxID=1070314 RepID=UPI001F03A3BA|nr:MULTISPECIES: nucleotidyltransferase domain-containing protein [Halorussus]
MNDESTADPPPEDAHADAAAAFVDRERSRHGDEITGLYVFGSTVRGGASGRSSDVDVLVVLSDGPDGDDIADSLRDTAYDAMLEHGPVVELHILTESPFTWYREEGNPFVRNAVAEDRSYA